MQNRRLTLQRLLKQEKQLNENPIPGVFVRRQDTLNFHFLLYKLEDWYEGGFYHGKLQLHQNYPFAPPKLIFFTPNGRFQINQPICTTFTNYHSQQWSTVWNVRTLIIATISFMIGNEQGYGCISTTPQIKQQYAKNSLQHNMKNQTFRKLFSKDIDSLGIKIQLRQKQQYPKIQQYFQPIQQQKEPNRNNNNGYGYIVAGAVVIVVTGIFLLVYLIN